MEHEKLALIAQLLASMKEAVLKLDEALKKKDYEQFALAKRELLRLQLEIEGKL